MHPFRNMCVFCIFLMLFNFPLLNGYGASGQQKLMDALNIAEKNIYVRPVIAYYAAEDLLKLAMQANDSNKIALARYYAGIYHVYAGNVDEGTELLEKALLINRITNNGKQEVDCLIELGEINYNKGFFERALNHFFEAGKISKKINYRTGEASAMNYIGKYHHSKGNYKRSQNYYFDALYMAREIQNENQIISIKNNLGKHYETLALFNQALKQYLDAFHMLDKTNNKVLIATTYNHLGNIYEKLGDDNQALMYHRLALKHREEISYLEGIAKSQKNIGEIFEARGNLDSALICYQNSFQLCQRIGYKKGMIKSMYLSGNIYRKLGAMKKSEQFYLKAINLSKEIGYEKGCLYIYLNLARLYLAKQNTKFASEYIQKGIALSKGDELTGLLADFYFLMVELQRVNNNHEKALEYYVLYADAREFLIDQEKNRNIEELKIAFETERKEQQNKILRQENELKNLAIQRKNAVITAIIITLILLTSLTLLFYYRFIVKTRANNALEALNVKITEKNKQLDRLNKELDKANHEKDKFFSIIGHELRNPLWWFKNLSETLSKKFDELNRDKLHKALISLNDSAKTAFLLIDNLLQWSRNQLGRLSYRPKPVALGEIINRNTDLFKHEFELKNIRFEKEIDEQSSVYVDTELVDTVFRNLISNAIKYTPEQGTIHIKSAIKDDVVEVCVSDTGIGISKENQQKLFNPRMEYTTLGLYQEKGSGLGLLLCKDFIEMNGGRIWLESQEGKGTSFYVTLPLVLEEALV
jgi:signal transduction histidine kinase